MQQKYTILIILSSIWTTGTVLFELPSCIPYWADGFQFSLTPVRPENLCLMSVAGAVGAAAADAVG